MIPRASRRYASTARPKQPRKTNNAAETTQRPHVLSAEEQVDIIKRRIDKAERDERMDITLSLTPVKTYMGGFTRPRDFRALYWSKGGRYHSLNKGYESPPPSAYQPHTVYLLEGRYYTKHGPGRADTLEHIVGVCRESDFPNVLQKYNSDRASLDHLEAMDNARWPWTPQKTQKRVKWWAKDEDPKAILREINEQDTDFSLYDNAESFTEEDSDIVRKGNVAKLVAAAPGPFSQSTQIRAFHSSARVLRPTSYNEDHIVPDFYVKHKQRSQSRTATASTTPPSPADTAGTGVEAAEKRAHDPQRQTRAVRERHSEEASLMQHLSDSILSDEIAASTRRLRSKIPVEHYDADGVLVHPSGFVVPSTDRISAAAHSSSSDVARWKEQERDLLKDTAAQTAAVAERVLESDLDSLSTIGGASTRARNHKIPFEVREPDGTIKHPSGFVPPTPAHEFKYSDSASLEGGMSSAVGRMKAREGKKGTGERGIHTTAARRAMEVIAPVPVRERYLPTLAEKPFYRPLLTLTVSTRPLGSTLARLSRALPKGLPFYASIPPEDRKHGPSYSARMRCLRLGRMSGLAGDMGRLLDGERGGFIGIRFESGQRGRAVMGEGLEDPVPQEKRMIGVGVGSWYARADEVRNAFERSTRGTYDVYALDDFGTRQRYDTGEVVPYPLANEAPDALDAVLAEKKARKQDMVEVMQEKRGEVDDREMAERQRRRNERKKAVAMEHGPELAKAMAGNVRGVVEP